MMRFIEVDGGTESFLGIDLTVCLIIIKFNGFFGIMAASIPQAFE